MTCLFVPGSKPRSLGVAALAAGVAMACVAGAATGAPYNPDRLVGQQIAQVDRACGAVLGLEPGETQYAACVASLSDSLRGADQGRSMVEARRACRREGFGRDTSGLAECTLHSADRAAPAGLEPAAASPPPPSAVRSYFEASRQEVYRREQDACAALGFDPTGGGFADCVQSVRSALLVANNPD